MRGPCEERGGGRELGLEISAILEIITILVSGETRVVLPQRVGAEGVVMKMPEQLRWGWC